MREAARASGQTDGDSAAVAASESIDNTEKQPTVVFRGYRPRDAALREVAAVAAERDVTADAVEKAALEVLRAAAQPAAEVSVLPRKANWDLKRDVQRRLEVLERRTQVAIVEMISASPPPKHFFLFFTRRAGDKLREAEEGVADDEGAGEE